MIHWNIEQGSQEWHRARHGKIGGTGSLQLIKAKKLDIIVRDIVLDMIEPFDEDAEEQFLSRDVERGKMLEPEARHYASQYTGYNFLECGLMTNDRISLLQSSPDGLTKCETIGLETKCPAGKAHTEMVLNNEMDPIYSGQIGAMFANNDKMEKVLFMSYRPEFTVKPAFMQWFDRSSKINIGTELTPKWVVISEYCKQLEDKAFLVECAVKSKLESLNNTF